MPRSAPAPDPHLRSIRARAPWWLSALGLALATGCTQSALVGRNDFDGAIPVDGPGYVNGALHAHAVFDQVDSVLWIGGNGDPARLELYIFEVPATCEEISTPGWIDKVRPTDLMGITLGGTTLGRYAVSQTTPPAPGAAYLHHVIDQTATLIESLGAAGSVHLTSVKPGESLSGNLAASFVTGTTPEGDLQGAFNATWCPTGVGL